MRNEIWLLKPTSSLSLIGLKPTYLSLSSLLSPLSYICIYLVHDRVTSNPIFLLLSFASLTWYQSAARGKKNILGFPLRRRRPVLRRRHHQPSSPCLLVVALPPCIQPPCRLRLAYLCPGAVLSCDDATISRRRPASSSSPCLPASSRRAICAQPPCCLRPAVVVCSAQQSRPAVVALPPCIQPPCCLRPAAVLLAPSRRGLLCPAVTHAITLPAPSRQARRRAQQSRALSPYLRPAVRHAVVLWPAVVLPTSCIPRSSSAVALLLCRHQP